MTERFALASLVIVLAPHVLCADDSVDARARTSPSAKVATASQEFDLAARRREHWVWQPVRVAMPPVVRNESWPANPIDRFVLAKLEDAGLGPTSPADRRVLLRRIYFDLVGLPPAPHEIQAFDEDQSPDAFEKVVDRLLASPHFGERWGR